LGSAVVAIIATDANGRVTLFNPAAEALLGYSADEVLERVYATSFHDRNELLHRAQQASQKAGRTIAPEEVVRFLAAEAGSTTSEWTLIRKDGSRAAVLACMSVVRDHHHPITGFIAVMREITTGKEVDEAVRASEERFRAMADSATAAIVSVDDQGVVVAWNLSAERLFGYSSTQALGQSLELLLPDRYRTAHRRGLQRVGQGGPSNVIGTTVELHGLRKDGSEFPLELSLSKWRQGGRIFFTGIMHDISARTRAAEALQRSERNLAVTLQSIGEGVLTTNVEGCVTSLNAVAEQLTGWSEVEAVGRPVAEVLRVIDSDSQPTVAIQIDRALSTDENARETSRTIVNAKDGTRRQIAENIAAIKDRDGRTIGTVAVLRDVTEEHRSRRQIESLLRELKDLKLALDEHDIVSIADALGRITFVNDKFCAISGYTREELIGQDHRILNSRHHPQEFFRDLWATIKQGRIWKGEIKNLKKDGSYYWVAATIVPLLSPEGRPGQFVAIRTDVTAQKTVEEELRVLNTGLEQLVEKRANELKKLQTRQLRNQRMESIGTLAGGVAHDLNNALAPIVMAVDLLKTAHPEDAEMLNAIAASAKRGADIVQHLLNFARGTDGEHLALQPADLVTEVVQILQASFPKNIRLAIQPGPRVPSILGDASQLHHVLVNLCVNARDAMPNGGKLTLETQFRVLDATAASQIPGATPGEYVVLSVRDTGTGIPSDILDRIFDPFFTTKPPESGTGLGLSNVQGIVKGHGGFLQVYSQPGQGTCFFVYLPAARGASDQTAVPKEVPSPGGNGESILFVDDESSLREISRLVLQRLHFKPMLACDGADALACVAKNLGSVNAIITDLHMPRMDGLEFIRAARALLPDVPVMVCSGRIDATQREELARLDVTRILTKPFTERQLAETLKDLLSKPAHDRTGSASSRAGVN
jgi:PAS domain S-box-containing protein